MNDPQQGEKKIIVDEDWKAQVEAERAAAHEKTQAAGEPSAAEAGGSWPQPSLPLLVTTLATEAMVAMGVVAHPLSGKVERDIDRARHVIDTIAMLEEKTAGNRTAEETQMFSDVLHELRMSFVALQQQHPPAT